MAFPESLVPRPPRLPDLGVCTDLLRRRSGVGGRGLRQPLGLVPPPRLLTGRKKRQRVVLGPEVLMSHIREGG